MISPEEAECKVRFLDIAHIEGGLMSDGHPHDHPIFSLIKDAKKAFSQERIEDLRNLHRQIINQMEKLTPPPDDLLERMQRMVNEGKMASARALPPLPPQPHSSGRSLDEEMHGLRKETELEKRHQLLLDDFMVLQQENISEEHRPLIDDVEHHINQARLHLEEGKHSQAESYLTEGERLLAELRTKVHAAGKGVQKVKYFTMCPNCGVQGIVSAPPKPEIKIKCPKCTQLFTHRTVLPKDLTDQIQLHIKSITAMHKEGIEPSRTQLARRHLGSAMLGETPDGERQNLIDKADQELTKIWDQECPECGVTVAKEHKKCHNCGEEFEEEEEQKERLPPPPRNESNEEFECPECGGSVDASDTKCKKCGAEFDE